MKTSIAGRKLIESFEGLRLTSYQDQGGVWTIGYGSTMNVWPNMTITQEEADDRLATQLFQTEQCVINSVSVPLNQNQFDALVSFVYNIGCGAFKKSTLLKLLNYSSYQGAANQLLAWNKVNGVLNVGLTNRRNKEREVFLEVPNVTGTT